MPHASLKSVDRSFAIWTVLVLLFLYLPIAAVIVFSFNRSALNIRWEGFTLEWYTKLMQNTALMLSVRNSLIIAAFTTIVSVLLGTLGAWLLHQYRYPFSKLIDTLILTPVVMPEIIMGISLLIFFAVVDDAGNRMLAGMGMDSQPMSLGFTTVILSHVTFCFPFVLIPVRARLAGADPSLVEAAMDLGATPSRAFWAVMVPYLMPAIVSGALMAFTLSLDELIITYFTAGPGSATLPLKIFGLAKVGVNPSINAISTLLIVLTALLVIGVQYLWKRADR
ncbi:MAG TPA: ABC transporter permease [Tepidisphaeraceae bacterium]|jgi:spermidine/putrescine transport system permease protein